MYDMVLICLMEDERYQRVSRLQASTMANRRTLLTYTTDIEEHPVEILFQILGSTGDTDDYG